jgi:hypothetical protein
LTVSRVLVDQSSPQRKNGSCRPRKVTYSILSFLPRHINKYLSVTAGLLRATAPDVAALSYRIPGQKSVFFGKDFIVINDFLIFLFKVVPNINS